MPLHIYPVNDLREHITSECENCWCNPTVDEYGNVIHNSMDEREPYEEGRKMQ